NPKRRKPGELRTLELEFWNLFAAGRIRPTGGFGIWLLGFRVKRAMAEERKTADTHTDTERDETAIVCPVCGAAVVQEKCKLICRSDVCRGRVVMNCSEF